MSDELNMKAERAARDVYENGPEGMPRVKRMPSAVLDCIIDHSLFRYLGGALEGDDRDRLHALMHDTANEALARIDGWPSTAPVSAPMDEELPAPDVIAYTCIGDNDAYSPQLVKQIVAQRDERIRQLEREVERAGSVALGTVYARERELAERKTASIDTPELRRLESIYTRALGTGDIGGAIEARKNFIAYIEGRTAGTAPEPAKQTAPNPDADPALDPLYDKAVRIVRARNRASVLLVQRELLIGYNRASRLFDAMEASSVVSPCDANGHRTVIAAAPTPMNSGKEEAND